MMTGMVRVKVMIWVSWGDLMRLSSVIMGRVRNVFRMSSVKRVITGTVKVSKKMINVTKVRKVIRPSRCQ